MGTPIKLTKKMYDEIHEDFIKELSNAKLVDGKFKFEKAYEWTQKEKATVCFTADAYCKMYKLVQSFSTEIAWHGVAKRSETDETVFIISDILVYPQEVSAAFVDTDQKEYQDWLYKLPDDIFNNLRMQGHSHVNMSTSPSGTDLDDQKQILDMLDDTMFYIFMIWNKSNSRTIRIFDMANNTMYDNKEVDVVILTDGISCDDFVTEAKKLAKDKVSNIINTYAYKDTKKDMDNKKGSENDKSKSSTGIGTGWKNRGRELLKEFYSDDCYNYEDYDVYPH